MTSIDCIKRTPESAVLDVLRNVLQSHITGVTLSHSDIATVLDLAAERDRLLAEVAHGEVVRKGLISQRDSLKESLGNMRDHIHVDATPDAELPARILSAYIDESVTVSEPPGLGQMMQQWQVERNAILYKALQDLAAAGRLSLLEDICARIYYARIAMNAESVAKHLDRLDALFRDPESHN